MFTSDRSDEISSNESNDDDDDERRRKLMIPVRSLSGSSSGSGSNNGLGEVEERLRLDNFYFKRPRFAIVLIHGLFGFDKIGFLEYWKGIKKSLDKVGVEVYIASVPATASIESRAIKLQEFIEKHLSGRKVNLIGHSMGGLDCRYLISILKPKTFQVVSLTTITTPHRGCSFADYLCLDIIGSKRLPILLKFLKTINIPGGGEAFEQLTIKNMKDFNEVVIDDPNVSYYSYGAYFKPDISRFFRLSWYIVKKREGLNDGLVSIKSAAWGDYQGTLAGVHHLDVVGWTAKVRSLKTRMFSERPAFDVTSFYLDVIEGIAYSGF
ncbi:triacylglycerol lipase [Phakopsora pachyrhizi]|uniref:Triacylglycerol lipase n=1 Tax=Phakopsora pachyrhizi TaxID=170000 RepID=A0AAV0BPD3_PHAPC|nr:triacylglycerol lipase [Phakopsora pachyrhizi]